MAKSEVWAMARPLRSAGGTCAVTCFVLFTGPDRLGGQNVVKATFWGSRYTLQSVCGGQARGSPV